VTAGSAPFDILHATCVAHGHSAVLILGASGAGKSALALDLLSRGCVLVSDDRTRIALTDGDLTATVPGEAGQGLIEARGIGILRVPFTARAHPRLAVDLDAKPTARLPDRATVTLLGREIDLIRGAGLVNLGAVIHLLLTEGALA
jgi:HPr kinase/phosphorylase